MIVLKSWIGGIVGLTGLLAASTGQADALDERRATADLMLREMGANFPALNASVSIDGAIVWEGEAGVLRSEKDGVTAKYNIYSIAKMMTGLAFARLDHEGVLALDTPVRAIDPDLPASLEPVRLHHLLSHLGGIRHYSGRDDWIAFGNRRCGTPADALPHFMEDPLVSAPGAKFQYSTYGFALASHLLVRALKANSYDAAMRTALGEAFRAETDRDDAEKATNYVRENETFVIADGLNAQCKFGGGGLLASARDLALFGEALYAGRILPLDALVPLLVPAKTAEGDAPDYNLGMGVGTLPGVDPAVHFAAHSGGSPGGRGFLAVLIEPKVAVAFTSNFDGPHLGEFAVKMSTLFAGIPFDAEDAQDGSGP